VFSPIAIAKLLFASPCISVALHSDLSSVAEGSLYSNLSSHMRHGVPRLSVPAPVQ
jgi:hypothetical protein